MSVRRFVVSETEWWDRVAMAVDRLAALPGVRRLPVVAPGIEAHQFDQVRDVESLRRLTQMPDETPLDMLVQPLVIYCPDLPAFVSVNDPGTPLSDHLKELQK